MIVGSRSVEAETTQSYGRSRRWAERKERGMKNDTEGVVAIIGCVGLIPALLLTVASQEWIAEHGPDMQSVRGGFLTVAK